jgi:hypothetical protein
MTTMEMPVRSGRAIRPIRGATVQVRSAHDFDRATEFDEHALEIGDAELASGTDRTGTGERSSAAGDSTLTDDADIQPDRIDAPYDSGEESET